MINHRREVSHEAKRALLASFYEYFLITLPVGLYVGLEALHRGDLHFGWRSPEWAIATVFLAFQSLSLYRQGLKRTGRSISEPSFGLFALGALIVIVSASINAFKALEDNSTASVIVRAALFLFTSIAFVLMVSGSKLASLMAK